MTGHQRGMIFDHFLIHEEGDGYLVFTLVDRGVLFLKRWAPPVLIWSDIA